MGLNVSPSCVPAEDPVVFFVSIFLLSGIDSTSLAAVVVLFLQKKQTPRPSTAQHSTARLLQISGTSEWRRTRYFRRRQPQVSGDVTTQSGDVPDTLRGRRPQEWRRTRFFSDEDL